MSTLPKIGEPFEFFDSLTNQISGEFQVDPTIEVGDFQINVDGGPFVNMTNLPSVSPAGTDLIKFNLTAAEMSGPNVTVKGSDQSGGEWSDVRFNILVPEANVVTVNDILEGDHVESNVALIINKKGTTTPLINKDISGSLLQPDIVIRTTEA